MHAKTHPLDDARDTLFDRGPSARLQPRPAERDDDELSCPAFGFLRGLSARSLGIEFRLKNGDREAYPYGLLAAVRFNPSAGLLLKFTGDVTTLVLVRGSNLDLRVHDGSADLIEALQRHRIVWVREMDEHELRRGGDKEPTIDGIEVAEFETQEELREWVKTAAPDFLR